MRKSKIRNKVKRGVVFFLVLVLMLLPCGSFFGGILTVRAENFTIRKLKDNSIIKNGNFAFYGSPLRSDLLYWIKSDGTPLFCVEREKHIIANLDGSGIVEEFGQSHYLDEKEYELVSLVLQCCGMNHGEKTELHPGIYLAGQCAVWGITSSNWQGTEDFRKEMEKVYDHIEDWYETPAEEILVYSQETVDRICEAIENYYGDESPYIPSFTSKYKLEAPVWEVRMKQDRSCTIEFALDGKSESIKDFVFQTPEEWTYEWQDDRVIFYGENVQEGLISITGRAKEGTNLDEAMPIGLIHIVGPKYYSFFQRLASSVECETNWSCYFQLMVSESEEESTPSETEPEETTPSKTEPEETKPEESTPSESEKDPEETLPEETKPSDEDKPSESKPDKPEESSPSETEPEETLPEETKPSDENKPSETEPEETKPSEENKPTEEETKPNETEPEETKPSEENKPSEEESKPNESEPEETKPSIEETEPTKPDTKPNPSESEETKPSEEVKDPEETEPSKPSETKPEESSPSESEPEETKPDTKPNPSESEGNKEETDKPEESKPNIEESKPSDETQEDNNKPTKPDTIPTGNGSHGGGGSHSGGSSTVTVVNVHEDKPEPEKKTIDENGVPQGETDKEEVNTTTLDENGVPRDKAEKEEQDNIDSLPKTGDKRNIFIYWITFMSSLSSIMFMGLKDKMRSRTSKEKTENKIK